MPASGGSPSLRDRFWLEDWLVVPPQNLLSRNGEAVHVRPKVMDLLVVLAEHSGVVVSGEDLQMAVWGRRYLARSALAGAICELREALRDDPQQPRFVETVSKRGYRLMSPVSLDAPEAEPIVVPSRRMASGRMGWVLGVGAVAIVSLAFGVTFAGRAKARTEATDALARGARYLHNAETADQVLLGIKSLEQAVRIAPASVAAHVELAHAHAMAHHIGYDRSAGREALARHELEVARRIAADATEVLWGEAFLAYVFDHDYRVAMQRLDTVKSRRPGSAYDLRFEGIILRRVGRFAEALERLREAAALEPGNWKLTFEIAATESTLGQYEAADRDYARSIELAPDQVSAYYGRARNVLLWKSSVREARAIMEAMPPLERSDVAVGWLVLDLCARDFDVAIARLGRISDSGLDGQDGVAVRSLIEAETLRLKGDAARARVAYETARAQIEPRLAGAPDDWRLHSALAVALAGLGRRAEATNEARRGVELCPPERDAMAAPFALNTLAEVQVMTGDLDGAMGTLGQLVAGPTVPDAMPLLELEPWWEPLRGNPGFAALVARQRGSRVAGSGGV